MKPSKRKSVLQQSVESSNASRELQRHLRYSEENGGVDALLNAARQHSQSAREPGAKAPVAPKRRP